MEDYGIGVSIDPLFIWSREGRATVGQRVSGTALTRFGCRCQQQRAHRHHRGSLDVVLFINSFRSGASRDPTRFRFGSIWLAAWFRLVVECLASNITCSLIVVRYALAVPFTALSYLVESQRSLGIQPRLSLQCLISRRNSSRTDKRYKQAD